MISILVKNVTGGALVFAGTDIPAGAEREVSMPDNTGDALWVSLQALCPATFTVRPGDSEPATLQALSGFALTDIAEVASGGGGGGWVGIPQGVFGPLDHIDGDDGEFQQVIYPFPYPTGGGNFEVTLQPVSPPSVMDLGAGISIKGANGFLWGGYAGVLGGDCAPGNYGGFAVLVGGRDIAGTAEAGIVESTGAGGLDGGSVWARGGSADYGGYVDFRGGYSNNGVGGFAHLYGGDGSLGGGPVNVFGGVGYTGNGGDVTVNGGTSYDGYGGDLEMHGGDGTLMGGNGYLYGGNASAGWGGTARLQGGEGGGAGNYGGFTYVKGGEGLNGPGGYVTINGGNGSGADVTDVGGNVDIAGGYSAAVGAHGGIVTLIGGAADHGPGGKLILAAGGSFYTAGQLPGDAYLDAGYQYTDLISGKLYLGARAGGSHDGFWLGTDEVYISRTGGKVGFFGAAAAAKPTGVAVDAAGIHAALVSLGLISA